MYPRIVCAFAIMLAVAFVWPSEVLAQSDQTRAYAESVLE